MLAWVGVVRRGVWSRSGSLLSSAVAATAAAVAAKGPEKKTGSSSPSTELASCFRWQSLMRFAGECARFEGGGVDIAAATRFVFLLLFASGSLSMSQAARISWRHRSISKFRIGVVVKKARDMMG